jgi:hypothetical protein
MITVLYNRVVRAVLFMQHVPCSMTVSGTRGAVILKYVGVTDVLERGGNGNIEGGGEVGRGKPKLKQLI